ncbi:hypothetical protein QFZ20_001955 [Flavobacterium sp. W4I14]|nr:hypothetical protein [Flavobacterium sp. W4I14]
MDTRVLLGIIIFCLFSCKNEKVKEENNFRKDSMLTKVLTRQLQEGPTSDFNDAEYSLVDFEATIPILKSKLEQNGFKFINRDAFVEKVKVYFNRIIDIKNNDKYLYLNYLSPCSKKLQYHPNDHIQIEGTFILKNQSFIADMYSIPEILDYQKKYPELEFLEQNPRFIYDEIEKQKVEIDRWKDLKELPSEREKNLQTFIHRNKYLFNDSRSSLTWLLFNDKDFLKKLLVVFGFDKEPKINKMVLDSIYKENTIKNSINGEIISSLFFVKDCNNNLQIKKGLLKYVEENTNATDNRFIYALGSFMSTLYDGDEYEIFDEDPSKKFTPEEKAEIVANIANIENPAREKYKSPESSDVWNIPGSSLYNLSVSHPEVIKIIEEHNYFGLPKMKEIIAKLQEEAPPTGADPE